MMFYEIPNRSGKRVKRNCATYTRLLVLKRLLLLAAGVMTIADPIMMCRIQTLIPFPTMAGMFQRGISRASGAALAK